MEQHMTPKQTPTLGNGMLYLVHRDRQRMIASMERRKAFTYIGAIAVGIATIIWMTWL